MNTVKRNFKRIRLSCLAVLMIAVVGLFSGFGLCAAFTPIEAYASEETEISLSTPSNLVWKDESTATAAWDAVEGANYYVVNVNVFSDGNNIGTAETGTSDTEVDLQHEINTVIGEHTFDGFAVTFTVKAQFADDNILVESEVSSESPELIVTTAGKTQLPTPTNLVLNDDYTMSWGNYDSNTYDYNVYYKIEYNGNVQTGYASYIVYNNNLTPENGVVTADFSVPLKNAYEKAGYSGETVDISFRIDAKAYFTSDYKDSPLSEYSNSIYYNPAGSTVIDEITLSPEHPVIAVGRSMYIGKTITPANAYYSKVNWSSDDSDTAPIDANGKVTGSKKGNANITAQINNATKTIPVSIYEIASNVDDSEQSTDVMDTAKDVIDSLIVDGDASRTDINDVDAACEEIVQAAQDGDQFNVDLNIKEKEKNELEASWSEIQDAVGDKEFAAAYDVTVGISHTDSEGDSHLIGNLTLFDNEVGFELEKPDNLPAVTENCNREFSLARIHEGNIEEILLTETDEGNYAVASNVFSDFVILYKDVPCNHDYRNPVFNWSDDGKNCTVTYTCAINSEHKDIHECIITEEIKTPATCVSKGTTTYTATYGKDFDTIELEDIDVDKEAHKWNDNYTIDKEPTCTEAGSKSIHCSVCNEIKEDSIVELPAAGHNWDEGEITTAPRCATEGVKTYTCKTCGDKKTETLPVVGHKWNDDYTVDKEPTCTEVGSKSIHCFVCDEIQEGSVVEVPANGHSFVEWQTVTPSTCEGEGTEIRTCSVCGTTETQNTDPAGHTWDDDYTVDKQPTCTEDGSKSIPCINCEVTKDSVTIPATGHSWNEGEITKAATCTQDGEKKYTCSACGESRTETVSATGHTWNEEPSIDKAATCTEVGSKSIHCTVCDAVKEGTVEEIPATGHAWDEGAVIKEAGCVEDGTREFHCINGCGETYTEAIPAIGHHNYATKTTKATLSKNGSIVEKCSVCGDVKSSTTIYYPKTFKLSATSYTYTGKALKPAITITDANGKQIAASNYTVTYSNNKAVGKATVKITFKGNYSGTKSLTFKINPKGTTISKVTAKSKGFTVKWKKQATQTTGYQIQYSTSKTFASGNKTVTVTKNKTVSKTISKLKAMKKYYVRIRTYKTVSGTKYYSAWSKAKYVTTKK